jgi:aquaporin Z
VKRATSLEPWQASFSDHMPEYAAEFLGTLFLLFCVLSAVSFMFGNGSPMAHLLPAVGPRLFLTGLLLGSAGGVVAISPPGRLSGAHLNPAVSLSFLLHGKMHPADFAGYLVAQCCGGIVGTWLGALVWTGLASSVRDALNTPAPGVAIPVALAGETVATFCLTGAILLFVSNRRTAPWTPALVAVVVGLLVWSDGQVSGAGMNPARSLGPAAVLNNWSVYWVYAVGPMMGGALAAAGFNRLPHLEAVTAKLFHDVRYRSIFDTPLAHASNDAIRGHHSQLPSARPRLRR